MRPDDPTPARGVPLPRPPAPPSMPRPPQMVRYVQFAAPLPVPRRRRRRKDSRAVGTLIFLVLVAIAAAYLYPTIRDAMGRDALRRSIAGVPGVNAVVTMQETTPPPSGSGLIVSIRVSAVALNQDTAERVRQRAAASVAELVDVQLIMSDGTRVYWYGWGAESGLWGVADYTGITEPF